MFKSSAFTKYKLIAKQIKKDSLRKYIKDKMKKKKNISIKYQVKYNQFENASIRSNGQCSICIQPYVYPVTIQCGHTFCRQCLQQTLAACNICCSLCRTQIINFQYNHDHQLAKFIDQFIVPLESPKRQIYQNRFRLASFIQKLRVVDQTVQVGDHVDVLLEKWQNAEVRTIIIQDGTMSLILQIEDCSYTEQLPCRLLATSGFYTKSLREKWQIGFKTFSFDPKQDTKSMKDRFQNHLLQLNATTSAESISDTPVEQN